MPRFAQGVFLGYNRASNTYIVGTPEGIVASRALNRRPIQNRWDHDKVSAVAATPWSERTPHRPTVRFTEDQEPLEQHEPRAPPMPRNFQIKRADLIKHGYTDGCDQCEYIQRHGENRPGYTHSPTCRARIMAELAKDPAGQARLQRTEQRINRALSDIVQHEDESAQPAQPSLGSRHAAHEPASEPARSSSEAPPAPVVADPEPPHE